MTVLRSNTIRCNTAFASEPYKSFAKDSIDDKEFERRINQAFFAEIKRDAMGSRLVLDTTTPGVKPDDSCVFQLEDSRVRVYFSKEGLDTNRLYVFFTAMNFRAIQQQTGGIGSMPRNSDSKLMARLGWLIYDPKIGKAVAGGQLEESSTTFAVIINIITQSDWFANARNLASDLEAQIVEIR